MLLGAGYPSRAMPSNELLAYRCIWVHLDMRIGTVFCCAQTLKHTPKALSGVLGTTVKCRHWSTARMDRLSLLGSHQCMPYTSCCTTRNHKLRRVVRGTGSSGWRKMAGGPRRMEGGERGLSSRGAAAFPRVIEAYLEVKCANRHDVRATTMLQQTCSIAARALQPGRTDCDCFRVMYQ